ncbi:DUF742 domain-containing protein [Actinomadura parmotrematis]|uniref:DUF742 domain-containing protein n=1 Tax=Actinomadura parmotrematis TaxID=2864039 RepID=A0ABS7FXB8_9ACTN|nr:DUF742 domain-containing protein [Actinomadura parmotrematis]MBW8485068.1 DUF742 domain-containing protein [Actinomadura parmotrematis]
MMPPEDPPQERWPEEQPQPQPQPWPAAQQADPWTAEAAGPMVRPYVMTSGRIEPTRGHFDLITMVVAAGPEPEARPGLGPEHLAILRLSQAAISVAELTGLLDLPVATVRVLLGDLLDQSLITLQEPEPEADMHDIRLYQAVIDGLRAL